MARRSPRRNGLITMMTESAAAQIAGAPSTTRQFTDHTLVMRSASATSPTYSPLYVTFAYHASRSAPAATNAPHTSANAAIAPAANDGASRARHGEESSQTPTTTPGHTALVLTRTDAAAS